MLSAVTLPAEIVAGLLAAPQYDWLHQTISELGIPAGMLGGMPMHSVLNLALVLAGACLVAGTVLLLPSLGRGWRRGVGSGALLVCGASTAATGLIPLDVDVALHVLVSIPTLALAAVPGLALGPVLLRPGALRTVVLAVSVLALPCGIVVGLWIDAPLPGLLERAAVWPTTVIIALLGVALVGRLPAQAAEPSAFVGAAE